MLINSDKLKQTSIFIDYEIFNFKYNLKNS